MKKRKKILNAPKGGKTNKRKKALVVDQGLLFYEGRFPKCFLFIPAFLLLFTQPYSSGDFFDLLVLV